MSDCPECDARLGATGGCKKCGWQPVQETPPKPAVVLPMYRPFPDRKPEPEQTPLERKEILEMLDRVKNALRVGDEPPPKTRKLELVRRCPDCANGNFIHLGMRFCAACYGRL